jgi:hypothetical protein
MLGDVISECEYTDRDSEGELLGCECRLDVEPNTRGGGTWCLCDCCCNGGFGIGGILGASTRTGGKRYLSFETDEIEVEPNSIQKVESEYEL